MAGRDRDREARRHGAAPARLEHDLLHARQIEPGVARIGAGGHDRVGVQAPDEQFGHTRNAANRPTRSRGRRAVTSTPSAASSRAVIGAPLA